MNEPRKNLLKTVLLAVALCALPALAGPDTYGLGTGKDGALTVSVANTQLNFYSQLTAPAAPGDTTLGVSTTTNFSAGDLVLVMQMTGIVPEPPSGGSSPIILTNDPVGRWELARLTAVTGTSMTLDVPLVNSYAGNVTQIIRVREYTAVTINTPGFITAPAWNGKTGGVVAFLATGALALNAFPSINVTGKGFRGGTALDDSSGNTGCTGLDEPAQTGAQKGEGIAFTRFGPTQTGRGRVANGGAGGVCLTSGGGGGANGGAGGQGGNSELNTDGNRAVGGQGGAALTYDMLNHLVMGGGGGAGHVVSIGTTALTGGAGGGIIFVRANTMTGSGTLVANGATGGSTTGQDAASGGGGGGSIYVRIAATPAACGNLQAIGGTGGNANGGLRVGPGGGGGGGRVLVQRGTGTCNPTSAAVIGASGGVQQDSSAPGGSTYGAQAGTAGSTTVISASFFPTTMPVPVVTAVANGSRTNNSKPPLAGSLSSTPPAGTEVALYVDGAEVARVTPSATNSWTSTPTAALTDGTHTLYAITINTSQAVQSTKSNTNTFTVDTTPPPAPVVTTPANGSQTNNNRPVYAGTAEANSTITVYVDGSPRGNITADASGNWSLTQPTALADDSHWVKATATDAVGNTSVDSNIHTFTVDTTPPPAPVVTTPANGSRTNNARPVYTGTADPGSTVTVIVDGSPVGTTTVDASGNWSLTQPTPLADDSHWVKATATDSVGNTGPTSNTNTFTVDTTAPAAPVVTTPANGAILGDNTPAYTGTAEPGGTVTVIVDDTAVGTTPVDASGNWSFTSTKGLSNSQHSVKATATDAVGNTGPASTPHTFTVNAAIPAAPVVTGPTDGTGTHDNTPTYTGTAEPGSLVTVLIDGGPVGTTTADAVGNWTLTPATSLADGPYTLTATATSNAGNVSPPSTAVHFTVDTVAPDTILVSGPSGDTEDTRATFGFSSEAGATFECSLDGGAYAACTTPSTFEGLSPGPHTFSVRARDSAGNVDPTPATATWNVVEPTPGDSLHFRGGGVGCASTGGDPSALAMMGLAVLSAMLARKRRV